MENPTPLALFSEVEYEERAPKGYPASCPTLDLSATWDAAGRNLFIYRPPSQAVSKIHQVAAPGKDAPVPQAVTWKPDGAFGLALSLRGFFLTVCCRLGQFLAVGWNDGFVRLMGLETNKAAHHIQVCESPDVAITHIGWAISSIVDKGVSVASKAIKVSLAKDNNGLNGEDELDLPRELAFLEVDTTLPKISPLPSSSAGAGCVLVF